MYLPEELKARVERAAAAQGTSEAEVIRSAIEQFTAPAEHPRPRLPLFDTLGDPGLSERVDEALAQGFGRD